MTLAPDIALVVVNYGSHELLEKNLGGLAGCIDPTQIVVVDNFRQTEDSRRMTALATRHGWSLVALPTNQGFGSGTNAGVAFARNLGFRRFLLINPDARIDEAGIEALARECAARPDGIVGARILRTDGSVWFHGGTILRKRGRTSMGPSAVSSAAGGWITGACMMIHADLWDRLGGFDDAYFLYWEDVDLSWRCTEAGGHLTVLDDVTVEHSVGGTQRNGGKSTTYVYFNCRNRLLFAARHLPRRQRLSWLLNSPGYAAAVMQHGGRRALSHHPVAMLSAAIRGTLAGASPGRRRWHTAGARDRPDALIRQTA
ncbi:glycosyltransferase family 2 protein [Cryobacterium sp. MLB-32]|uniref:glycosyltransferase family 2 protein n=1 Tax=Cryobacterium sp. MLB-32 TaxID=1529318 RepID=UPI00068A400D|nr:glycosyltransferase family 2 protein [Cryobacterium sp. MLB-32]